MASRMREVTDEAYDEEQMGEEDAIEAEAVLFWLNILIIFSYLGSE